MARTYYELLGVSPEATTEEIDTAYRQTVKETHPDVSDDPDATEQFQRVQRAREVLTDDAERARDDRLGHDAYVDGVLNPDVEPEADTDARSATGEDGNSSADADDTGAADATSSASASATSTASAGGGASASRQQSGDTRQSATGSGAADAGGTAHSHGGDETRSWANDGTARADRRGARTSDSGRTGRTGSAYATRTSTSHSTYNGARVPLTPRTLVTMITTFVLYPVFVFSAVAPSFPLTINLVLACCTLFVIAYLVSMPEIAIVVFGAWSVLAPLLLLSVESLSLFSLIGMVALVASWFPLGLALLARSALRL